MAESGIDPNINTDIDRDKWDGDQVLNQVAVDVNGDGSPDALAICNPDGTAMNESQGSYYMDDTTTPLSNLVWTKISFGFKAKSITLVNTSGIVGRTLIISFDGVNIHGIINAGESFTYDNIGKLEVWLKKGTSLTDGYRLYAY